MDDNMKRMEVLTFIFAYSGMMLVKTGILKSHPNNTIIPNRNMEMAVYFIMDIILSWLI
jgi:hypothetical protein